jgi:multiple sugar transport system permease protein
VSVALSARAAAGSAKTRKRANPTRRRQTLIAYVMLAPFAIVFLTMLVAPLVFSGYLSVFRTQLVGGTVFVGLENYAKALVDPSFLGGLGRVGLFLIIQVPIMLGLALLFALALDSGWARANRFVRLAIFVPYAIPGVVATLMWGYMYSPAVGPIGQIFQFIGLGSPAFLSADGIIPSIMNIITWEWTGYNMIILYAALRSIPDELYEAAEVDGAGPLRIAWSIKIPAIRPALILTGIFAIIGTFQIFNEPKLLYEIAPNVIGTDFTPNLYAYNEAFISRNIEYAAALAFLLGLVIMILSYVFQLGTRRKETP